jgi:hypothetical protein
MPTLQAGREKIHKRARPAPKQYRQLWDALHREEDRATILAAAQTMIKYLDVTGAALAAPK